MALPLSLVNKNRKDAPSIRVEAIASIAVVAWMIVNKEKMEGQGPEYTEMRHSVCPSGGTTVANAKLEECLSIWYRSITEARGMGTKVVVRFLGDLKEHEYPSDVSFFTATKDDGSDFGDTLRSRIFDAVQSGRRKLTMVNLANVREVGITIGEDVSFRDYKRMEDALNYIEVVRGWISSNEMICLES